jgi:transcriptional regulator with PAS, ATPase and Fis domain
MLNYDWPGNVRALRHSIERAIILAENDTLDTDDLQLSRSIAQAPTFKPAESAALNLDQIEKRTIETALRKHAFNISHAAKELGLTRASLYRRMEKHGL